jgi:hypothetical protein
MPAWMRRLEAHLESAPCWDVINVPRDVRRRRLIARVAGGWRPR